MTFSKFYGERALYIQNFTAFCSAFSKVCEFGLKDVTYTYKCTKFHPSVSFKYSTSFYQSNLLSIQMNKDKADVKKICFRSNGLKKTHPGSPQIFFFSKITISLFLKIALFICMLQFLSSSDVLFYFTP